jgi:hypothetical protein
MLTRIVPRRDLPAGDVAVPDAPSTETPESPPREQTGADGLLVVGRKLLLHPKETAREIALRPLMDLVRQTTLWAQPTGEVEERMGDFRFLVLEFKRPDDLLAYVQIWSEPTRQLIMEVGPGKRSDPRLQAFADRIVPALAGRGFEIGGNAGNFHKTLPIPTPADQSRIANEMLSLLIDVLDYDGRSDLAYKMGQGTFLKAGYVITGISRSHLQALLRVWGLETTARAEDPTVLDARSHGFVFRLHLCMPKANEKDVYWEVHCRARFAFPRQRITDLLADVNERPWLLKASALGPPTQGEAPVALSYGFNLAGGVTHEHLKNQLFEWLETVRRIRMEWARPAATTANAEPTSAARVH